MKGSFVPLTINADRSAEKWCLLSSPMRNPHVGKFIYLHAEEICVIMIMLGQTSLIANKIVLFQRAFLVLFFNKVISQREGIHRKETNATVFSWPCKQIDWSI